MDLRSCRFQPFDQPVQLRRSILKATSKLSLRASLLPSNSTSPEMQAYTTERAKKNGLANASSGKVFVTSPGDHFGPITAFHDPVNRTGVRVGSEWGSRMECRQWGVHMPPVAGISGQSGRGAQSVVISGGYEDDEDHGWYFIYTGR